MDLRYHAKLSHFHIITKNKNMKGGLKKPTLLFLVWCSSILVVKHFVMLTVY